MTRDLADLDHQMDALLSPVLRRVRLSLVGQQLNGRVLDYGCGKGELYNHCASEDYTGVDVDKAALAQARQKYPYLRFYDTDEFRDKDEHFDSIACTAVIALVDDKLEFLRIMKRRLNDGGKILITTPHPRVNWVHRVGVNAGFMKDDGYAQRKQLGKHMIANLASRAGLRLRESHSFMFGMNQLFVLTHERA
jgi:SAM-dependent methyltransferase